MLEFCFHSHSEGGGIPKSYLSTTSKPTKKKKRETSGLTSCFSLHTCVCGEKTALNPRTIVWNQATVRSRPVFRHRNAGRHVGAAWSDRDNPGRAGKPGGTGHRVWPGGESVRPNSVSPEKWDETSLRLQAAQSTVTPTLLDPEGSFLLTWTSFERFDCSKGNIWSID